MIFYCSLENYFGQLNNERVLYELKLPPPISDPPSPPPPTHLPFTTTSNVGNVLRKCFLNVFISSKLSTNLH